MLGRRTRAPLPVAVLLALATGCGTRSSSGGPITRPSRPTAVVPGDQVGRRRRAGGHRVPDHLADPASEAPTTGPTTSEPSTKPTSKPTSSASTSGPNTGPTQGLPTRGPPRRAPPGGLVAGTSPWSPSPPTRRPRWSRRLDGRRRERRLVVAAARRAGRRGRGHGAAGTPCAQQAGLDGRPRGGRARGRLVRARPRARAAELRVVRGCQRRLDGGVATRQALEDGLPGRDDGAGRRQPGSGRRLRRSGRHGGRRMAALLVDGETADGRGRSMRCSLGWWACWSRPT